MPIFISPPGDGADPRVWKTEALTASDLAENINLAAPGATIGGLALSGGPHRVLLRDQTDQTQNGIYSWNGAATPLVRTDDADTSDDLNASAILVDQGNSASCLFIINANDQQPLDSGPGSEVEVIKAGSSNIYTEGDGIDITSNVISAQPAVPLGFDTSQLATERDLILESSTTAEQLLISSGTTIVPPTWGAVNLAGVGVTGTLPIANGGTGATTLLDVQNALDIKQGWMWTAKIDSNSIIASQDARQSARAGFQTNFQPFPVYVDCELIAIMATCRSNIGGWFAEIGVSPLPLASSLSMPGGTLSDFVVLGAPQAFSAGDNVRFRFTVAGGGTDVRDVVIHGFFKAQ